MNITIRQQRHLRSPLQSKAERELDSLTGWDVAKNTLAVIVILGVILYSFFERFA